MTTTCDALRTTFIFRFRTLTNNLNFLNQRRGVYNLIELFLHEPNKNCGQSLNRITADFKVETDIFASITSLTGQATILVIMYTVKTFRQDKLRS
jgi:hypothetical protein